MKQKYYQPDVNIEIFSVVDVVTTSSTTEGSGGDGPIELPDFPVG